MAKRTPMMEQYLSIKNRHKDAILFFRMGDFYEMFFEDAKTAAKVLGLTLTSRNHGQKDKTPLAGIPYHAAETYLAKLVRAGYKVAICEQVEDPKKAKGLVKRDVIEVVTPGTTLSEKVLDAGANNFLAAVSPADPGKDGSGSFGFAYVDLSTGEFFVTEGPDTLVLEEALAAHPAELIVPGDWGRSARIVEKMKNRLPDLTVSLIDDWLFGYDYAYGALTGHFGTNTLKGFGCDDLQAGAGAAGAVISYLKENQKNRLSHIKQLKRYQSVDYMLLDPDTQRNLEIVANLQDGGRSGSLLSVVDRTRTPMGSRLLRHWLLKPLLKIEDIRDRHDAVDELITAHARRGALEDLLKGVGDLERLIARVCTGRASARDLVAIRSSLETVPAVKQELAAASTGLLKTINDRLGDTSAVCGLIRETIIDEPPLALTDGGIIRQGCDAELDELRTISHSGKDWIARMQNEERERTGIGSLKVEYNKVFGYYIEVTKTHLSKVPDTYVRKQTLVNAERFITPELKEYEAKVLNAESRIGEIEYRIFSEIRDKVAAEVGLVQAVAGALAVLDNLIGFAVTAQANRYVRPVLTTDDAISITDGRHPVVERILSDGDFVPNDLAADCANEQVHIITGPNMAGKSTYLRQVGLIVLLAHIGSFVPAAAATIGLVDRIFTRVGASDNLARGESTFLVEMNETANILNNATSRSLVLLDEIGRGTSTFDGLSIAWAVSEYIHNSIGAKTLFATHYHELTELELILPRVVNCNVLVKEFNDTVTFLRKIERGGCDSSYGIQVARLAGLPDAVIVRAKEVLHNLEQNELTPNKQPKLARGKHAPVSMPEKQLDIFTPFRESPAVEELKKLDLNTMTPLDALNKLNELKKLISGQ